MPIFTYRATNQDNKIVEATTSSETAEEASLQLTKKGLTPLSIKLQTDKKKNNKSLPSIELITFSRYMGTMLKSGLSVSETISVLLQETTHPLTKKILSDLSYGLNHGQSISSVFEAYPETFDKFFITIVKSGEISGTLAKTFSQLEKEIRSEYELKQKIQGALLYPSVVFIAMIGIGVLMFFFILPQIGQVFLNLKLPLHPATLAMFKITIVLGQRKFAILGLIISSVVVFGFFLQTKAGKKLVTRIVSSIPVAKNLIKQTDIARFCRTFSTLMTTGVPITEGLTISLDSMSYPKFTSQSKKIIKQVTAGQSLAQAFKGTKMFPALLNQMISSGEKSGTLDTSLKDLGEFYEREVENSVKKATQILEPILMLLVGIGVGIMVLSVIAPIYSVVSNLQLAS